MSDNPVNQQFSTINTLPLTGSVGSNRSGQPQPQTVRGFSIDTSEPFQYGEDQHNSIEAVTNTNPLPVSDNIEPAVQTGSVTETPTTQTIINEADNDYDDIIVGEAIPIHGQDAGIEITGQGPATTPFHDELVSSSEDEEAEDAENRYNSDRGFLYDYNGNEDEDGDEVEEDDEEFADLLNDGLFVSSTMTNMGNDESPDITLSSSNPSRPTTSNKRPPASSLNSASTSTSTSSSFPADSPSSNATSHNSNSSNTNSGTFAIEDLLNDSETDSDIEDLNDDEINELTKSMFEPKPVVDPLTQTDATDSNQKSSKRLNNAECPICYEPPEYLCAIPCGHVYCRDCISKALVYKEQCGICRKPAKRKNIIFLKIATRRAKPKHGGLVVDECGKSSHAASEKDNKDTCASKNTTVLGKRCADESLSEGPTRPKFKQKTLSTPSRKAIPIYSRSKEK